MCNGLTISRFEEMCLKPAFEVLYGVKCTEFMGEIIP